MSEPGKSAIYRYGCAFLSVAAAVLVRRLLDPLLGNELPIVTVFIAVIVTAWYGGFRPAFAAVIFGAFAADLFLLPPRGSFHIAGSGEQIVLAIYVLASLAIAWLGGSLHDARERARSSAESNRRQAALINQTYDPVLVWEWNGPITFWNRGAERLYGFSREEALGRVSHDLLRAEIRDGGAPFIQALERNGWWEGELQHTHRDGHAIYVESRMVLIRDAEPAYVIQADRDITGKEDAAKALREINETLDARVRERTEELAHSNEKLRVAEERNRLILEGVRSHAVFMLDPVGKVVSWNLGAERIQGYTAEEIIGRHYCVLYTPEDVEAGMPERHLQIAVGMGSFEEESWRLRKNGSRFWAIVTITPLYGDGPDPVGFVKVTRDISVRKKIQEDLRASEERFRLLVDGVSDYAILMLSPDGIILTWNRGAERIDGYTADEIVGRHYSCLFTPENIAAGTPVQELAQAAVEGKVDVEGWRVKKNGTRFWVTGTLSALYDDRGTVQGFAKITRDLTQKRHDDELLRSVLDNTLDGIIGIDELGTISMINRSGEAIFGRSGAEVIGQNVKMLMPEPYHSEHDGYLANYRATGVARIIGSGREVRGLRKDGSIFPLDLAVTEFRLDDSPYYVGIVRDISEKKKLEAQLQQSQKMEAFGQLAGGIAHDFNNLLTVITGYGEMLLEMLQPDDLKTKMVEELCSAGEHAANLTRQLLAFSRQQVLEPRTLDLNAIVNGIGKMLRRLIGEDVQFATVLRPGISSVRFDPGQIEQVIMNLAVNARDAMPQGGKLTIETTEIELGEMYTANHPDVRPGLYVRLVISDTGSGMTPEVRARIFEPFFTTKGIGKGTGLGLAVVHGIVKQSGGTIEVYSEPGIGTSFKIYLPAIRNTTVTALRQNAEITLQGTETILLVEDEEGVRELSAAALRRIGYTVLTAEDGETALGIIASHQGTISLLLTDVVMPGMSGRELSETIVARFPGMKTLFLSGYTDDAVVRHGILLADVAFLQKPFTPSSLAKKVREVLDQS